VLEVHLEQRCTYHEGLIENYTWAATKIDRLPCSIVDSTITFASLHAKSTSEEIEFANWNTFLPQDVICCRHMKEETISWIQRLANLNTARAVPNLLWQAELLERSESSELVAH
jgi:hypothetical protein